MIKVYLITGHWTAKGYDTTGVFRPSNGHLYLRDTHRSGVADIELDYGAPGDKALAGDWNGDGRDTVGAFRNGQMLLRNSNTNGFADIEFSLGMTGDEPIAGDWDGLPSESSLYTPTN